MRDGNKLIVPWTMERVPKPTPDVKQLVLKEVKTTESVYQRILYKLFDATLPTGMLYDPEKELQDEGPTDPVPLDLFFVEKYRQDWIPNGYGVGELVFSISLLPNEELTLELKTWETDKRVEELDSEVEDKNTTDIKSVASDVSETTTEQNSKEKESVDAKASYGGFGFNVSCAAGWSNEVEDKRRDFGKQTHEQSEQATNQRRSLYKTKVAVAREAGSESKTTRKVRNINQAHTLNANYYEILREYQVKLVLYDVCLLLLGDEPRLQTPLVEWSSGQYYKDPDADINDLTNTVPLGRLIEKSRSGEWIQRFIRVNGVSPIKLLREEWAKPLKYAALSLTDWTSGEYVTDEERTEFRDVILRYIRPSPGWVEADEKGALRWGYEVLPEKDSPLLLYLYKFLPGSYQQLKARGVAAGMEPGLAGEAVRVAYAIACGQQVPSPESSRTLSVINRGKSKVVSLTQKANQHVLRAIAYNKSRQRELIGGSDVQDWLEAEAEVKRKFPALEIINTDEILAHGPFCQLSTKKAGTEKSEFEKKVHEQVATIRDEFARLRIPDGKPVPYQVKSWTTTLPTQGLYADLSLGVCSGAEDYYEIQRQFDLELKEQEVEKLRLQVEKMKLENQAGEQRKTATSVVIKNPTEQTAINLGVNVSGASAEIEIQKEETSK